MSVSKSIIGSAVYYILNDPVSSKNIGKLVLESDKIKNISIYPEFRGKGYSTKLWEYVKSYLIDQNCHEIHLYVMELSDKHGKLVNHYIDWGFIICGSTRYINEYDNLYRCVPMKYTFRKSIAKF